MYIARFMVCVKAINVYLFIKIVKYSKSYSLCPYSKSKIEFIELNVNQLLAGILHRTSLSMSSSSSLIKIHLRRLAACQLAGTRNIRHADHIFLVQDIHSIFYITAAHPYIINRYIPTCIYKYCLIQYT